MKRTWVYRERLKKDFSLSDLEADLQATLKPVEPRPVFRSELKVRLNQMHLQRRARLVMFRTLVLIFVGLISSVLIVITSVRAAITILGLLGIFRLVMNGPRSSKTVTSRPAG